MNLALNKCIILDYSDIPTKVFNYLYIVSLKNINAYIIHKHKNIHEIYQPIFCPFCFLIQLLLFFFCSFFNTVIVSVLHFVSLN